MYSNTAIFSVDQLQKYSASNISLEDLYVNPRHTKEDLIVKLVYLHFLNIWRRNKGEQEDVSQYFTDNTFRLAQSGLEDVGQYFTDNTFRLAQSGLEDVGQYFTDNTFRLAQSGLEDVGQYFTENTFRLAQSGLEECRSVFYRQYIPAGAIRSRRMAVSILQTIHSRWRNQV